MITLIKLHNVSPEVLHLIKIYSTFAANSSVIW